MKIVINITNRTLAFFYWLFSKFWYRLEVLGGENVAKLHGPLLLVVNHKSMADHFFFGAALPRFLFSRVLPLRIMAKDSFFTNPISAFIFRALGCYPANYGQGIDVSLATPLKLLQEGEVVGIYPEGRRIYTDEIGPFKRGAGELIRRAGVVTVVPIAVVGATKMFGQMIPRFRQKVTVVYGKPMVLDSHKTAEEISQILREQIVTLYNQARVPLPRFDNSVVTQSHVN